MSETSNSDEYPTPAEGRVVDLMGALEQSVRPVGPDWTLRERPKLDWRIIRLLRIGAWSPGRRRR